MALAVGSVNALIIYWLLVEPQSLLHSDHRADIRTPECQVRSNREGDLLYGLGLRRLGSACLLS